MRSISTLECCCSWWSNSLFTPRQESFVLSWPSFQFATVQFQLYWGLLKTWKLETGPRQDKTVLSCLQLCSHRRLTRTRQDKTVLSCPCRRRELAIIDKMYCCLESLGCGRLSWWMQKLVRRPSVASTLTLNSVPECIRTRHFHSENWKIIWRGGSSPLRLWCAAQPLPLSKIVNTPLITLLQTL